jgi:8-oxo-dGTP pyrophosphatase MutT (NUDIX family)
MHEIEAAVSGLMPHPIGCYGFSSVLLPLVERPEGLHLLFEVRSDDLKTQPGEVSFPGGKMERGETPESAALRETCEELNVPRRALRLITQLNYIVTYSNFTMYSCLGTIDASALDAAAPNPDEVKEIFFVPLTFFLENEPEVYVNRVAPDVAQDFPLEKIHFKEGYSWREGRSEVPLYTWRDPHTGEDRVIWGLTARLVHDFVRLLRSKSRESSPSCCVE